jgi:glutaredoxin 2
MFAGNADVADSYMEKTEFQTLVDEIRATLTGYIAKLENNTFTKTDLADLKTQSTTYLAKKKAYELSMPNIDHMAKGIHWNRDKALLFPWYAIKDI